MKRQIWIQIAVGAVGVFGVVVYEKWLVAIVLFLVAMFVTGDLWAQTAPGERDERMNEDE